MPRKLSVVVAAALLSLGFITTDAGASYSGSVYRTVCPSGGWYSPNVGSGFHPDSANNSCWLSVSGLSPLQYGSMNLAVPFESTVQDNNVFWCVAFSATDVTHGSNANVEGFSFDASGNVFSNGSSVTTTGSMLNVQTKCSSGLVVPANGATVCDVSAQNGVTVRMATAIFGVTGS